MFRNHIKALSKDTLIYGLGSTLGQLTALVLVPFYSEALSPAEYGVLAMLALINQFISPVFSLGLDNALFRFFSLSETENERNEIITTAAIIRTLASIAGVIFLYCLYPWFNQFLFEHNLTPTMWSLALCTLYAGTFGSIAEVVIRVQRKPWIVLTISMLNLSIGTGLSIWWVLGLNWGITGALGAGLATQIVNAIAYSIYLQPYIKPATFSKTSSNKLLQYALPYIPHRIQAQVMQTCALFLVNQHLGLAATGIYAMVGKFVKPLNMLVDATQRAWVPYKFHVHKTSAQPREIFRRLIGNYWLLLLLIWGIACFIFPFLFKMLVSPRYFSGISYFPFLAFIPLVQAFYYTVTVGVEINKNQRILPISSFWGMFATVILGLSSAPFWSPYGPILALISGYLVIAYVVYLVTSKLFPVKFYLKSMALLLGLEIVLLAGFYADIISLSVTLILLLINIVWFIRVFMLVNDKNIELPYPKIRH